VASAKRRALQKATRLVDGPWRSCEQALRNSKVGLSHPKPVAHCRFVEQRQLVVGLGFEVGLKVFLFEGWKAIRLRL
jgi:hypothetical protein